MQIYFTDDVERPVDEDGEIIEPSGQNFINYDGNPVTWYASLYVNYDENTSAVNPQMYVTNIFAAEEVSMNDIQLRVLVEISTDSFKTVLFSQYLEGFNKFFQSGGNMYYYARSNSNKYGILRFTKHYNVSGSFTLPVLGQAYSVRLTAQYMRSSVGRWYNVGQARIWKSWAPFYQTITKPAAFYGNTVNTFAATIGAAYRANFSTTLKNSNTSYGGYNEPVRNESYPYIEDGTETNSIYWFPQLPQAGTSKPTQYSLKCELTVEDPGDPDFRIAVAASTVSGDVSFLADDDNSMFTAAVEFTDPSGLFTRYGYLLRNTDASLVSKATFTAKYGGTIKVGFKSFNPAHPSTNYGYGDGYELIYSGKESKSVSVEQNIPSSGTKGATALSIYGLGVLVDVTFSETILDYFVPSFPSLAIHRCEADGTANDNGDHCKIEWAVSIMPIADQNSKTLVIDHPEGTEEISLTSYGQAGTMVVAASTESAYDITFMLKDDLNEITRALRLSTAGVIMDWLYGGKGVAFGRVAETENAVEISSDWDLILSKMILSGVDMQVWMSELLARLKAVEQYLSNEGSSSQFEVSFYSDSVLLDRQWVLAGENAEEPEVTPERAATETRVYSFVGWALTEGATVANPNALNNITAGRTIYAAFSQATRYYSVKYLNAGALLETVTNLQYHGNASYSGDTPTSDNADDVFAGWAPSGRYIADNEEAQAQFFRDIEITDTWDEILEACKDGSYKTKYHVGMYKPLDLGAQGIVNMHIHAFQKNLIAGGKRAPIAWIADRGLKSSKRMNPALVTHYDYTPEPSFEWRSANANWRSVTGSSSTYNAKITFELSSATAGDFVVTYGAGGSNYPYNHYRLTVNGAAVDTQSAVGSGSKTYTHTCTSGEKVTVVFEYYNTYTATLYGHIKHSGQNGVAVTIADYQKQYVASYEDGTGSMGGWASCELRKWLRETVLPLIPENVRNGIREVKRYSYTKKADDTAANKYRFIQDAETADKLAIPAYQELFGKSAYGSKGIDFLVNDASQRIRPNNSGSSAASAYCLRTCTGGDYFYIVNSSGNAATGYVTTAYSVVIEFDT